ncbi:MAG: hypothetical protein HZC40_02045, partial [Chloroflexi bacterium]|nr:hypothetical protein [Chloroflexota bacterium]
MKTTDLIKEFDPARDCVPASETDEKFEIVFADDPAPSTIELPQRPAIFHWLERAFLAVEKPVNRIVGAPQLNPFYYTGQIAVFLFGIIAITGLFLVLFFQVGFDYSYLFVSRIESQPIARVVRAAHRYSSDAFVIVSIL